MKRSSKIVFLIITAFIILFIIWWFPSKIIGGESGLYSIASKVVDAYEENSIEPIKGLLSKSALETTDLNTGIEYGHKLLEGKKIEDITLESTTEDEKSSGIRNYVKYSCVFNMRTNDGIFYLSFQYFSKNSLYSQDSGLYRLYFETKQAYEEEAENRQELIKEFGRIDSWNYGATYERAGIYNPEWQTNPPPDGDIRQNY